MSTHYPSQRELQQKIQSELDWVTRGTVYAEDQTSTTAAIDYLEIRGERRAGNMATAATWGRAAMPSTGALLQDLFALVREIGAHAEASTAQHYKNLFWSGGRGNRVREELLACGFIAVESVRGPRGGRPMYRLSLTEKGREFSHERH